MTFIIMVDFFWERVSEWECVSFHWMCVIYKINIINNPIKKHIPIHTPKESAIINLLVRFT